THLTLNNNAAIRRLGDNGIPNGIAFTTPGTDAMNDRMFIGDNGRVGIGTKTPSHVLEVAGDIYATGAITSGSSRTLKSEIRDLGVADAVAAFEKLRPSRFVYKANPNEPKLGFIAEDV